MAKQKIIIIQDVLNELAEKRAKINKEHTDIEIKFWYDGFYNGARKMAEALGYKISADLEYNHEVH